MPQEVFFHLSADWEAIIDDNLNTYRELVQKYAPASTNQPISLQVLDDSFAAWLSQHDPEQEDPNPIVNAFGIAFGRHLLNELDLEWVVVSGEQGTDIAVHGQPGDVLVFPTNFVAKRYADRQTGFFKPIGEEMKRDIKRLMRAG